MKFVRISKTLTVLVVLAAATMIFSSCLTSMVGNAVARQVGKASIDTRFLKGEIIDGTTPGIYFPNKVTLIVDGKALAVKANTLFYIEPGLLPFGIETATGDAKQKLGELKLMEGDQFSLALDTAGQLLVEPVRVPHLIDVNIKGYIIGAGDFDRPEISMVPGSSLIAHGTKAGQLEFWTIPPTSKTEKTQVSNKPINHLVAVETLQAIFATDVDKNLFRVDFPDRSVTKLAALPEAPKGIQASADQLVLFYPSGRIELRSGADGQVLKTLQGIKDAWGAAAGPRGGIVQYQDKALVWYPSGVSKAVKLQTDKAIFSAAANGERLFVALINGTVLSASVDSPVLVPLPQASGTLQITSLAISPDGLYLGVFAWSQSANKYSEFLAWRIADLFPGDQRKLLGKFNGATLHGRAMSGRFPSELLTGSGFIFDPARGLFGLQFFSSGKIGYQLTRNDLTHATGAKETTE